MSLTGPRGPRIRSTSMTRRIPTLTLLVTLLVVLAALTPLAYATPIDPVWVSGFFDDDDNDDGVFLVTSSLGTFFRGRALNSEARRMLSLIHRGQSRAVSEGVAGAPA